MATPRAVPGENAALTYRNLRAMIGWIGLSLPAVLLTAGLIDGHLESSLSTYYYTNVGVYFTGTLCVIGVFLLAYRFNDAALENNATTLAGAAALGVAFFHAAPPDATASQLRMAAVHLTCAAVLFFLLGLIAVVLFPTDVPPARAWQGWTYRALGLVIWGAIALMILLNAVIPEIYNRARLFFWLESVCVIAFASAFILKGHLKTGPTDSGAPSPALPAGGGGPAGRGGPAGGPPVG